MNLKNILRRKHPTGKEAGQVEIFRTLDILAQERMGVKEPEPVVDDARFNELVWEATSTPEGAQDYDGYLAAHRWIANINNFALAQEQQIYLCNLQLKQALDNMNTAEYVEEYMRQFPTVVTKEQYNEWAKLSHQSAKIWAHNPDLAGYSLFEMFLHALANMVDQRNPRLLALRGVMESTMIEDPLFIGPEDDEITIWQLLYDALDSSADLWEYLEAPRICTRFESDVLPDAMKQLKSVLTTFDPIVGTVTGYLADQFTSEKAAYIKQLFAGNYPITENGKLNKSKALNWLVPIMFNADIKEVNFLQPDIKTMQRSVFGESCDAGLAILQDSLASKIDVRAGLDTVGYCHPPKLSGVLDDLSVLRYYPFTDKENPPALSQTVKKEYLKLPSVADIRETLETLMATFYWVLGYDKAMDLLESELDIAGLEVARLRLNEEVISDMIDDYNKGVNDFREKLKKLPVDGANRAAKLQALDQTFVHLSKDSLIMDNAALDRARKNIQNYDAFKQDACDPQYDLFVMRG